MRALLAIALSLIIYFGHTPKADALVGVLIKQRTVRVVGGVVSAVGAGTFGVSAVVASTAGSWGAVGIMILSMPVAAVGLVILDEKNADLKFSQLAASKAEKLGVSEEELNVYNTEVDELNAVKEVIESQVTNKTTAEEIKGLWSEYKDSLSPETLKVAAKVTIQVLTASKK